MRISQNSGDMWNVEFRLILMLLAVQTSFLANAQFKLSQHVLMDSIQLDSDIEKIIDFDFEIENDQSRKQLFGICDERDGDGNIYLQTLWQKGDHDFELDLSLNYPSTFLLKYSYPLTSLKKGDK